MIKLVELSKEIDDDIIRYASARNKIVNQIQGLSDEVYIQILYKRYVENIKLIDVAEDLGYEYQTIRILHGKALKCFSEKYLIKK